MEILILLIVLAILAGLLLGPIGFFKAMAVGGKAHELEKQLDRLELDLNDTRSMCLQLRADLRAAEQARNTSHQNEAQSSQVDIPVIEPVAPEQVEPIEEERQEHAPVVDQLAEESAEIAPPTNPSDSSSPTTLQHLLDLQQHRDRIEQEKSDEPAPEASDPATNEPTSADEPVAQKKAAIETSPPIAPPVSTVPPIDPYEPDQTPTRRLTIEEVLAGKVFVWIGAIALVLTAAFLLKLGFDRNIITEPVRVIGAASFGIALWCIGEWMHGRVGLIAQALCGAAVAVLYASVLAANNLYGLFGPGGEAMAFGLMALITAAAILLSLRHGSAVAILGMLGGFMLPPLLTQDFGPSTGMILYLLAIEVGVLAVTGKRGWFGISLMTLIFSVAWSIGYTLIGDDPHERTLTAMLVLGTAGAYLFHTARIHHDPHASKSTRMRVLGLSIAATCSAIGTIALLAVKGDYATQDLGMLGLVAAGTLILARIDARQIAMPFVAMGLSLLVLISNAIQSLPDPPSNTFIAMAACFGALFVLGGYLSMWGSPHRRVFAVMCAIAGPAFYGPVVFAGHDVYQLREVWWPYTLGLAGLYALATLPMLLRRKAEHDWPIALFAVLSFVLLCISLGQSMDHPWLAVCLALVSAVAAIIDLRLFIRPLRIAACIVAFFSAVLLVVPGPFDLTIKGAAVFNTLLPMYTLPALSFGVIAWCAARAGSKETAKHLTYLCIATIGAILLVLIRQIFQPANFTAEAFHLYEWSTYCTVLLLAGFVAHWIGNRFKYEPILHATRVIVGLGAILALIGGLISSNPLFNTDIAGGLTLAAGLLALYAAPAALLWLWSRRPSIAEAPQLAEVLRAISITLVALFVGLQIRNGFQGADSRGSSLGMFECITYAVVWILLGGFIQRFNQLRLQSPVTRVAGRLIFVIGLLTTVASSVVIFNPLLTTEATGGWDLAGRMVVLYALPAALLWIWSRGKTLADQPIMICTLRGTSIAMLGLFVGLQIRNGFQSDDLQRQAVGMYECVTYMAAALLLGGFIQRLNQRYLRDAVTSVAGQIIFGLGVATTLVGSVVFNPLLDRSAAGGWDLAGDMAVLYMLPAALMWLWSRGKTLADQSALITMLRGASIAFFAIFAGLMVRNSYQADDLHALHVGLFECTTYGLAWIAMGTFFYFIAPRCTLPQATGQVGRNVFGIGLLTLLLGNVIILNPLWFRETVGSLPVLNGLWFVYGPLILILALLAHKARQRRLVARAKLAGFMAIGIAFMLLSMFVRHGFSGDGLVIITSNLVSAERYAYSLAWMLFGGAMLIAGVFTRLDTLRYASLAVLLLAVGKVFLIDTANLDNLYRVFSFFGLGVTLIGLGYLYQRLVFKRPNPSARIEGV